MRKYIRHPITVPVEVEVVDELEVHSETRMLNISAGGLAFQLPKVVPVGSQIIVSIPQIWPDYRARGTVVWCRANKDSIEAGLQFAEASEAFKARMVAQLCQIEDYRRSVLKAEGRRLTIDEAAQEWIDQFAGDFAEAVGW
jgi:hypothetical protein